MAEQEKEKTGDGAPLTANARDVEELVRVLGMVFSNTFLYGPNHTVTKKAQEDGFKALGTIFDNCEEIVFSVTENELMVNNDPVELKNPIMKTFVSRLNSLDISNFTIVKGLTREKYDMLVEVMNSKPEEVKAAGGFGAVLTAVGIDNVRTRTVIYKAVAEDDLVVSKKALEGAVAVGSVSKENIEKVLAFLKGEDSGKGEDTIKNIKDIATNTKQLGQLIMQAAGATGEGGGQASGAGDGSGEVSGAAGGGASSERKPVERVVDGIRKVYEELSNDPAAKTQKGKRDLMKLLQSLEKELLDGLKASGKADENDAKVLENAVEEMADELKIESLADEYMKKRAAIDENEKKILRFIKGKGLDKISDTELEQRLKEGGLPPEGWHELLVRSGARARPPVGDGAKVGLTSVGSLALLLANMEHTIEEGKDDPGKINKMSGVLAQIDRQVADILDSTEKKIASLADEVKVEEESTEAAKKGEKPAREPKMSRKELMKILAEIVQELCQPLSVIDCSLEMIKTKNLGEVNDAQTEMLVLAASNSARMRKLIDRLLEVSGVPKDMSPDATILASAYNV